MLKNSYLFLFIVLAAAILPVSAFGQKEELKYTLPCVYRVENWNVLFADPKYDDYFELHTDRAYLGTKRVILGRVDKWMVWAEFDLSSLAGKQVVDVGFRVFNSGTASEITDLAYSTIQPSTYKGGAQSVYESYNYQRDSYIGFYWPINAEGAWEPASEGFFIPGKEKWKSWKRNGGTKTIIQDIQDHINNGDNGKSWFAVVLSKFTINPNYTPSLNLALNNNTSDPGSIIMQVTVTEGISKEENLGCPDIF